MVAGAVVGSAFVTGAASAMPGALDQEALLEGFFADRSCSPRLARAVFAASGVRRRHAVLDPRSEDCSSWSTARRMDRFALEALPLATAAVRGALCSAGLDPGDVGLLAVVSCTGYATPGVDVLVARDLGLAPSARRLLVGHVGCHAALPGLAVVADFVAGHGEAAVLCCLELPSLHVQPPDDDPEQLVVHALFGDAAAAVVVEPAASTGGARAGGSEVPEEAGDRPLEVVATEALSDLDGADLMTWTVSDRGFRMTLSRKVPARVGREVGSLVDRLLSRGGLERSEVAHWAVHPGGPRVLDAVAEGLGLPDDALACSRAVLEEAGNCSSATVLLVLEALRARARPRPGDHVVLLAFGPGLTLYGALLRAR